MFGVLYWQAFSLRDLKLRMQFFLSFVLAWAVLGTGLATLFSSAGPCYYSRVVMNDNIYHPLMEYLNTVQESFPIWALDMQEMLWKTYENNKVDLGSGVSAMPSMHVSTSLLFALVGWRSHRLLGVVFSIFTVIIMFGSVHLGWHYAIDGYAAIFCTFLIWHAAGIFLGHIPQIDANTITAGRKL
jgi:membrane-associated phospholipid phosphatase